MTADQEWADLAGTLPTHQDEIMAAHVSSTVDNTPASGEGHGAGDDDKYDGGGAWQV